MMIEHPILFSGEMVKAILDGRKTQTRRVVKLDDHRREFAIQFITDEFGQWFYIDKRFPSGAVKYPFALNSPYGKVGDRLWVRESFREIGSYQKTDDKLPWRLNPDMCVYRADAEYDGPWRSPIHMPRSASRLTLEITDVRVERLQDISEHDAIAEGVNNFHSQSPGLEDKPYYKSLYPPNELFRMLWKKINGKKYPWDSNPFVWVLEFKKAK